jgi:hypothetical protein
LFVEKSKTVFVLGAGASAEVGFPLGAELKSIIAKKLNITFPDGYRQQDGDYAITGALREKVRLPDGRNGNINPYLHKAWHIKDAMPQAISIDNFLDNHSDDEEIKLCGKLAIVRSILESEEKSKLYNFNQRNHQVEVKFDLIANTWYSKFFRLLTQNCVWSNLEERLKRIFIINFNYDRSFEFYLFLALKNYYRKDDEVIKKVLNYLTVIHPYGSVGKLPWQDNAEHISYGEDLTNSKKLLELACKIKTFTERFDEEVVLTTIKKFIQEANTIIFLGFAYHTQNMELINPKTICFSEKVYATAKGISNSGQRVCSDNIRRILKKEDEDIVQLGGFTCSDIFDEFWQEFSL